MRKCIWFIVFGLALGLMQNSYAAKTTILDYEAYSDTETPFFDGEGSKVFLDQFEPNTVLLVFWATWCGTCADELPILDNLAKDFRKLPFKIIALSEDYQGVEVVKKYFTDNNIRHLDVFHDYQNNLFRSMSVIGLPTAFLINSNGKIKKIFKGRIKWYDDKIRSIILQEIDANPETPRNSYTPPSLNIKAEKVDKKIEVTPQNQGTKQ